MAMLFEDASSSDEKPVADIDARLETPRVRRNAQSTP
jgi:hypothetical protein